MPLHDRGQYYPRAPGARHGSSDVPFTRLPDRGRYGVQQEQARDGFVVEDLGGDVQIRSHTDCVGRGADEAEIARRVHVPELEGRAGR